MNAAQHRGVRSLSAGGKIVADVRIGKIEELVWLAPVANFAAVVGLAALVDIFQLLFVI